MQEMLTASLTLLFALVHFMAFLGGFKSGVNAS